MSWQKQKDQPLFPDLLWSRPENKQSRGKLLIIGGQAGQFTHVSACYSAADKAGAGHIRVLLPDSLRKVTQNLPGIEYAPSNASGSFARSALGMMNELSEWADAAILAGDFGKNSETTTILDGYLLRCPLPVTIAVDALSSVGLPVNQLVSRPISLVIDSSRLQKLPNQLEIPDAITSSINIDKLAEILKIITRGNSLNLICEFRSNLWVSVNGEVVSTVTDAPVDLSSLSAFTATWLMQQPAKPLQALATSCYEAART